MMGLGSPGGACPAVLISASPQGLEWRTECYRGCSPAGGWTGCLADGSSFVSVERKARERKASISDRLSGNMERGSAGAEAVGVAGAGAGAVSGGAGQPAAGILSAGIAKPAPGVLSSGIAGAGAVALSLAMMPLSAGVAPAYWAAGVSTLPRMIGNPSLPAPMITTFELLDCAS